MPVSDTEIGESHIASTIYATLPLVEEVKNGWKKLSFGVGTQKTVELQQQDCNS
ncbi:hypothetical protein P3S68_008913 [Capsicum galapagoense]